MISTSLLNQKFVTKLAVGRTPSSALDPWSGLSITRETRADGGPSAADPGVRPTSRIVQ